MGEREKILEFRGLYVDFNTEDRKRGIWTAEEGKGLFCVYCCCHLIGMSKATLIPAAMFYHLKLSWVEVHLVLHIIGKME